MKQSHNENRGVHSKSFIYWAKTGHCPIVLAIHIYRQHTKNGTMQKKKYSRSDFQGLLFVLECMIVIISSYILKDSRTTKTDLHYGTTNTGNSESCLSSSIVYTLQFNTQGHSLLELLHNGECISHIHIWPTLTTLTKTNA